MTDRYAGKPFLKLLEAYILWCIDELPPEQAKVLEDMTPNLQRTYSRSGAWHEIVAAEMKFSARVPQSIRDNWAANLERFRRSGSPPPPAADFAQHFADAILDL